MGNLNDPSHLDLIRDDFSALPDLCIESPYLDSNSTVELSCDEDGIPAVEPIP